MMDKRETENISTSSTCRVFRMDGKVATKALVVRTLLKERLYGDFTFIRQAQVGKIVQSCGSSKALASIISEVSGGACQKQAAAQAASGLTIFQTQLTHVRQSVAALQSCINSDNKATAAQEEYSAAVHVCNAHAQDLTEAARSYQKLLEDQIQTLEADMELQERSLADFGQEKVVAASAEAASLRDAHKELESLLHQLEQAQSTALLASEEALQAQGMKQELMTAKLACSTHAQHLENTRAALQAQEVILKGVKVALGSGEKLAALQKFRRDMGAAEDEAHRIRTALQASSHAVQEERAEQASLKEQLEQHVQSAGHRNCIQDATQAKVEADKSVARVRKELAAAECHAQDTKQKLLQRCPRLRMDTATPFLTAFTFKASCTDLVQQCQLALSLLMQPVQDVLLVPRMTDVSRVLKDNRGSQNLRIWPLDSISYTHKSSYLRNICKEWQAGVLVSPLDLCDFESAVAPAMQRVFGTVLLAANDHAASQVLARHGVPCITHAGTRHSKGSLEGGWRAPGSTVNICGHKVASQQACTSIIEVRECLQKCSLDQDRAMERLRACEEIGRVQTDLLKQVQASEAREKKYNQQLNHGKEFLKFAENKARDLQELIAGATCHAEDVSGSMATDCSSKGLDTAQLKQAAAVAQQRVEQLQHEVTQAETSATVLSEAQSELEQRLEGLNIDVLEYAKEDAEKRWEECEAAVNDCRMRVTVVEEACTHAATEQKLQNERIQNVKTVIANLTEALEEKRKEQKSALKSSELAKAHISEHGQRFAHPEHQVQNPEIPAECNPSVITNQGTAEVKVTGLSDAQRRHSQALDTFLKSQKRLKGHIKNQEEGHSIKDAGTGTGCSEDRHAADGRKEVLKRSQDHMKMLEEASQVLRKDVETSAAYSVTLGRAVFQRTALNFKSSMASAIPQFNFDVRMCGDGPEDGVEIIFREQFSKDTADEASAGVKPAVLLVDEVDAALDGVNQTRAGELLAQAASALHCQVWAISHSDAFHACCDTYLKVSKEAKEGTSVEVLDAACWQRTSGAHKKQEVGRRASVQAEENARQAVRPLCSAQDSKHKRGHLVKKRKTLLNQR